MSDSITPALIGVIVGIISTLLTIFLTPHIQHYFWVYQRLSDIRLAVIKELNNLAAEFLNNYLNDPKYRPTDQFFKSFMVVTANIKALFSQKAFDCFKEFEVIIGPGLGPSKGSIEAFIRARDTALRALYDEAIGKVGKKGKFDCIFRSLER
jgi:hypothetical protein